MKRFAAMLVILAGCAAPAAAGWYVPVGANNWTNDVQADANSIQNNSREFAHGESWYITPRIMDGTTPRNIDTNTTWVMYYQTPQMTTNWYTNANTYFPVYDVTGTTIQTGRVSVLWDASNDFGHRRYLWWLGGTTGGQITYRVMGEISLRDSPGFNAAAVTAPVGSFPYVSTATIGASGAVWRAEWEASAAAASNGAVAVSSAALGVYSNWAATVYATTTMLTSSGGLWRAEWQAYAAQQAGLTNAAHVAAVDPHGDRAYADGVGVASSNGAVAVAAAAVPGLIAAWAPTGSVAYATSAGTATSATTAGTVTGAQSNLLATATQPADLAAYLPLAGGTMSGNIDMSETNRIVGRMFGYEAGRNASGTSWTAVGHGAGENASGESWAAFGYAAAIGAEGTGYTALGDAAGRYASGSCWFASGCFAAGEYAAGDEWHAYGYKAGSHADGIRWHMSGYETGTNSYGVDWHACGHRVGQNAQVTNAAAYGVWAGKNASGNGMFFADVYLDDPGAGHVATNDAIVIADGQLSIGRMGALTNANPNILRGAWQIGGTLTGSGSSLTGITAAQVGALSTNGANLATATNLPGASVVGAVATATALDPAGADGIRLAAAQLAETVVTGAVVTVTSGNRYFWTTATNVILSASLTGGQVVNFAALRNTATNSITAVCESSAWKMTGGAHTNTIPAGTMMTFGWACNPFNGATNFYATAASSN